MNNRALKVIKGKVRLSILAVLSVMLLAAHWAPLEAAVWEDGDVFAGVGDGKYNVYKNDGTFKETLDDGTGGLTTGCAVNPFSGWLYTTTIMSAADVTGNLVVYHKDDPHHSSVIDTSAHGGALPESIVFAADGRYFVGHAGGNKEVQEFSPVDAWVKNHVVGVELGGSNWIDLASDQKTLLYTSFGSKVLNFDVSAMAQNPDFSSGALPPGGAFGLRIIPGMGGIVVANGTNIKRLDSMGKTLQTYDVPGEHFWFSVALDPNGTSFWAGGVALGVIVRFNIATGAVEKTIVTGSAKLFGLCVKGEPPVPPMFLMGVFADEGNAELRKDKSNDDKIDVKGDFWLDPGSDKLIIREIPAPTPGNPGATVRVIYEKITASFGGMFEETIPPNSLVEQPLQPGLFVYDPSVPPGRIDELKIFYIDGALHGEFEVSWQGLNFSPTTKEADLDASNPLAVPNTPILFLMDIGNDKGGDNLGFALKDDQANVKRWEFKK
ncbi:MAG: hypothetical protein ACE5GQ_09920 [Nitrospinales bacterium]